MNSVAEGMSLHTVKSQCYLQSTVVFKYAYCFQCAVSCFFREATLPSVSENANLVFDVVRGVHSVNPRIRITVTLKINVPVWVYLLVTV